MANIVPIIIVLVSAAMGEKSFGDGIQYFDTAINYWESEKIEATKTAKDKKLTPDIQKKIVVKEPEANPKDAVAFPWNNYLDPKQDAFFKEGDYMPPEPFMELARNPSDGNIKMWFSYIEKKNQVAERLAKRMEEYAAANSATFSKEAKEKLTHRIQNIPVPDDDFKRFRFRLYFDSTCPHCKKMFGTLNDLQDRGYFVEARQIDRGPLGDLHALVPIYPADPTDVKKLAIMSVPLLLIGDAQRGKVYRQSGFMTSDNVLAEIRSK